MRRWNVLLGGLALLIAVFVIIQSKTIQGAATPPSPTPVSENDQAEIKDALEAAALNHQKIVPAFMLYQVVADRIEMGPDGKTALVWMALLDPQTQQTLATEPGLAIAKRVDIKAPWKITLPTDQDWTAQMQSMPEVLLNTEEKTLFSSEMLNPKDADAADQVFSGYLLPWEGGRRVWLTGSVAHFTTYNSCSWVTVNGDYHSTCRYAFDFSDGAMFRVLAARGGSVVGARWSCADNDHNCLNYIALEDRTTTPVTTALYLHLAQNSIPAALRVNGAYANGGDFLGRADNTGMSTGHHLHFMVVANRWLATGYGGQFWWGDSVDITFKDVAINGGRPRLCSEVYYTPQYGTQCQPANPAMGENYDNWFISGNRGTTPPTATLIEPAPYSELYSPLVTLSGSASDNDGVSRIQVIANSGNQWVEVGAPITSNPFTATVDLCAAGIPNGPVTLALWAWDVDGTRTPFPQSARPVLKSASCPPPAPKCAPTADQVALYALPDYQGACQVFGVGRFAANAFGALGDNQAASIQVGARVMGVLYEGGLTADGFLGRGETFAASDAGLADNRIGAQTVSGLEVRVQAKPVAPTLRPVLNRVNAGGQPVALTSSESILLVWKDDYASAGSDDGGVDYRAELKMPDGSMRASAWQSANTWSLGSLAAGTYRWSVTARNPFGETRSPEAAFTVSAVAPPGGSLFSVPYVEKFENGAGGWTADGLWRQTVPPVMTNNNTSQAWGFADAAKTPSYASSTEAGGSLTSPPIAIPAGGAGLRFDYAAQTESAGIYWDQRRVQVALEGGAFQDVLQLSDDPSKEWQSSPLVDLSPYAGKTVRVRFYFNIVDKFNNGGYGWWVDNIAISTSGGAANCGETPANDTAETATSIALNQALPGSICQAGDVDFYRFNAPAGMTIAVDVVAKAENSALDPYLYLLDGDGKSILAENDDIVYGKVQDSHIQYTFQRSGSYYLKIKSYNHPGVGGDNFTYRLVLNGDDRPPQLSMIMPRSGWVPASTFDVQANAADELGVARVDFYWHSPDWQFGDWLLLASDTTAADGWKAALNPSGKVLPGSALAARAYDLAGLETAVVRWNVQVDSTAPATALQGLGAVTQSTVIPLRWDGADGQSGLRQVELQVSDNGGAWVVVNAAIPAHLKTYGYAGMPDHRYAFRLRGMDYAGNWEAFPAAEEAATTIARACEADAFDAAAPGDNSAASAVLLSAGEQQGHNFCSAGDQDWVRFTAEAGVAYAVRFASLGGGASAALTVTGRDGQTVLAQAQASGWGESTHLKFVAPADGDYFIRVQPWNVCLWGSDARYAISVAQGEWVYLPAVQGAP